MDRELGASGIGRMSRGADRSGQMSKGVSGGGVKTWRAGGWLSGC